MFRFNLKINLKDTRKDVHKPKAGHCTNMAIRDLSYNAGWRVEKHIRFMADIRNTGRLGADIVGFGDVGVIVSLNNGTGSFAHAKLAVADFGYKTGGWRIDKHLRFLGDVYGTGLLDIIGFGEFNVLIGEKMGMGPSSLVKQS